MKNHPDFYEICSPNKAIVLRVKMTDKVYYAVDFKGENIITYELDFTQIVNFILVKSKE